MRTSKEKINEMLFDVSRADIYHALSNKYLKNKIVKNISRERPVKMQIQKPHIILNDKQEVNIIFKT
jgi:hypothetical protein